MRLIAVLVFLQTRKLRQIQPQTRVRNIRVELVNKDGHTYAELAINEDKLLVLHYQPAFAR